NTLLESQPTEDQVADRVRELEVLTKKVIDDYKAIKEVFKNHYERFQDDAALQKDWSAINDVLAVPLIPADRRLQLMKLARKVSNTLNEHTTKVDNVPPHPKTEDEARTCAYRRARVDLAMLGKGWFGKSAERGHREYEDVSRTVRAIRDKDWEKEANAAGEDT